MAIMISMSGLDWSWAENPKTKKRAATKHVVSRRTKKTPIVFKSLAQQYAEIHGECR